MQHLSGLRLLQPPGHLGEGHALQLEFDALRTARAGLGRSVPDPQVQGLDSGGRVAQGSTLAQLGANLDAVDAQAACSGCALRASSRSTERIITDGWVSALSVRTTR